MRGFWEGGGNAPKVVLLSMRTRLVKTLSAQVVRLCSLEKLHFTKLGMSGNESYLLKGGEIMILAHRVT